MIILDRRKIMKTENTNPTINREFSFRAIVIGVLIGLLLMALMMYLDAVLGLDTDVAPIASMIGVLLIPLFGGPTNKRSKYHADMRNGYNLCCILTDRKRGSYADDGRGTEGITNIYYVIIS